MHKTKSLKPKTYNLKPDNGFIALVTLSIISVIALIVGLSVSLLSISEATMSLEKFQSSRAYFLANLCAEQALIELKKDTSYQGNELIEIEEGNCQILPVEGNWTVKVLSNFQNQIKKIKIVVSQVDPEMIINSWQQVPDF